MEFGPLLKRQIRKYLGDDFCPNASMQAFLAAVNDAYAGFDEDQHLMERSLEISSSELNEANERLRLELEQSEVVLSRLRDLGASLSVDRERPREDGELDLLHSVELLAQSFLQNKTAQEHLKAAKEQADLVYRVIPSAIFTVDSEGLITSWNKMAETITGYKQEEVLGVPRTILSGPDGSFRSWSEAEGFRKGQRCTILTKNRRTRIISKNSDLLRNKDGRVIGGIESFEDITQQQLDQQQLKNYQDHLEELVEERTKDLSRSNKQLHKQIKIRKAMETQLRSSQEKYELLAENLQETVFRLSPGGYFQYVSRSIAALAGYDARALEGVSVEVLFARAEEYREAAVAMRCIQEQKIPASFVFQLQHRDDSVIYAEMTAAPLIKESQVVAVQGALRDVTERLHYENDLKRAKEAAEQASRAKSTFLSTISHEIRTPLHCIMGFAELVNTLKPPEGIQHMLDSILNESSHLLSLINMLLDHAKIEAGKLDLVLMPFDFHRLCKDMDPLMRSMALPKELTISVVVEVGVPSWIVGDSMRIRQVLMNIVGNAVKFTHEGSVTLRVREQERQGNISLVEFLVIDTGVGIPADKLESVFDSFTQVDGRISRKYGGTGLGTTITKQLVGLMGGKVGLESVEGQGTTFHVWMPLGVASEEAKEAVQAAISQEVLLPEHAGVTYRVLVAEDNENGQLLARLHLESAGYEVDIASDGVEAIELYQANEYQLVLTDVQMPRMDGFETAEAIRALEGEKAHVPIVAMTANADTAAREQCMDAGMNDVITKPMRRKKLLETAARWLSAEQAASTLVGQNVSVEVKDSPLEVSEESTKWQDDIFSYQEAVEEFGGNTKLLRQAVKHYVKSTEQQVQLMRQASVDKDFEGVRKIAHKLRGASANITASRLQEIAGSIEMMIQKGEDPYPLEERFAQWQEQWDLFLKKLAQDPQCKGLGK